MGRIIGEAMNDTGCPGATSLAIAEKTSTGVDRRRQRTETAGDNQWQRLSRQVGHKTAQELSSFGPRLDHQRKADLGREKSLGRRAVIERVEILSFEVDGIRVFIESGEGDLRTITFEAQMVIPEFGVRTHKIYPAGPQESEGRAPIYIADLVTNLNRVPVA